jgi:hypothetical protein
MGAGKTIKQAFAPVTRQQCTEFGLVVILVLAFLAFYRKQISYTGIIVVASLLTIIVPLIFYPLALLWFGIANLLKPISSAILLTLIFLIVVVPVGFIRRLLGRDSLKIKQFKKSRQSVLHNRDHVYEKEDLLHTF